MEGRSVLGIPARTRISRLADRCFFGAEAVRHAGLEQVGVGSQDVVAQLLQRRDVIQDPKAAAVRTDNEIVEVLLNREPVHRCVRQVVLQRQPVAPVVERDIESVLCAGIEHPLPRGIFPNNVHVGKHASRDVGTNRAPAPAVVCRLVDVRIEIADLMKVDGDVSRATVVAGRFDVTHRTPRREVGKVGRDVGPCLTTVSRHMHQTVIRAGPDDTRFHGGFGDGEQHGGVGRTDVVRREPTGFLLFRFVVGCQVRTDHRPAVPTVGGLMQVLAPHIDLVVVVRRDGDRKSPLETVAQRTRGPSFWIVGPHAHVTAVACA